MTNLINVSLLAKVSIVLAKTAGCLQNGSQMLLMSWSNLDLGLFVGPKQVKRAVCMVHFANTQQF